MKKLVTFEAKEDIRIHDVVVLCKGKRFPVLFLSVPSEEEMRQQCMQVRNCIYGNVIAFQDNTTGNEIYIPQDKFIEIEQSDETLQNYESSQWN